MVFTPSHWCPCCRAGATTLTSSTGLEHAEGLYPLGRAGGRAADPRAMWLASRIPAALMTARRSSWCLSSTRWSSTAMTWTGSLDGRAGYGSYAYTGWDLSLRRWGYFDQMSLAIYPKCLGHEFMPSLAQAAALLTVAVVMMSKTGRRTSGRAATLCVIGLRIPILIITEFDVQISLYLISPVINCATSDTTCSPAALYWPA